MLEKPVLRGRYSQEPSIMGEEGRGPFPDHELRYGPWRSCVQAREAHSVLLRSQMRNGQLFLLHPSHCIPEAPATAA